MDGTDHAFKPIRIVPVRLAPSEIKVLAVEICWSVSGLLGSLACVLTSPCEYSQRTIRKVRPVDNGYQETLNLHRSVKVIAESTPRTMKFRGYSTHARHTTIRSETMNWTVVMSQESVPSARTQLTLTMTGQTAAMRTDIKFVVYRRRLSSSWTSVAIRYALSWFSISVMSITNWAVVDTKSRSMAASRILDATDLRGCRLFAEHAQWWRSGRKKERSVQGHPEAYREQDEIDPCVYYLSPSRRVLNSAQEITI